MAKLIEIIFSILFFAAVAITFELVEQKQKELEVYKSNCENANKAVALADSAAQYYFAKYIKCKNK